jgi:hypothetical protein
VLERDKSGGHLSKRMVDSFGGEVAAEKKRAIGHSAKKFGSLRNAGMAGMHEFLRSVDLKLVRADYQVRAIADQISAWCCKNPITARCELRDKRLGFRLILEEFIETAPLDYWGLLVGECIHNLRSALDNLAFALARLQRDPPRDAAAIHFPIYQDRSAFGQSNRVGRSLDQMQPEAASLIEQFQPFQCDRPQVEGPPETDALVLLQWLNNADKHRVPSVVLVAPTEMNHSCAAQFYSDEDAQANVPPDVREWCDALKPGVVLLEQRTNRPIASVVGSFYVEAVVAIQTLDKPAHVVETLSKLSYYTALVVDRFREFFK